MVTVYRFRQFDITSGEHVISRRLATIDAVKRMRVDAEVLEGSGIEVNEADLDGNGMTARDFRPMAESGFQRQMTS